MLPVPSAPPEELTARVTNETNVLLHWRPPPADHINGILTGYRLYLLSNATQLRRNFTVNITAPQLATDLTDLAPHTRYWVRVAAETAPGVGPATALLAFTTGGPAATAGPADQPRVVHEAWFIALLGFLVFVVVSLLVGLVYVKRQQGVKQALAATPGKSARQEAMWVDRGWRPTDSDKDSSLSEQKLLGYQQQQQAAVCAEYAELDPLRDSGPYASACVIRQNPLSRLCHAPPGYAGSLNLPPTSADELDVRGGFPTLPAGRVGVGGDYFVAADAKVSNRPSLADILPPPPTHPPPAGERLRPQQPPRGRYGHQCGAQCVECSCSEGESSYDNNPREHSSAPRT